MSQTINRKQIYPTFSNPKTFAYPNTKREQNKTAPLFSVCILDFEIKESEISKVLALKNSITNYIVNDGTKVTGYIVMGKYINYARIY